MKEWQATGDWVAILNSDDLWHPEKLERQIKALRRKGGEWSYTLGNMIDEADAPIDRDVHADWPLKEVQDILPRLLNINRILASSVVFRRGSLQFRTELRYCGDWVALLWLAEHCSAVCVAEALTSWRQHETNSYRRSHALTLEEILVRRAILDRKDEWLDKAQDPKGAATGLSSCALALSALYVLIGQMRLARAAAKMASRLGPGGASAAKRRLLTSLPLRMAQRRLWPAQEPVPMDVEALDESAISL